MCVTKGEMTMGKLIDAGANWLKKKQNDIVTTDDGNLLPDKRMDQDHWNAEPFNGQDDDRDDPFSGLNDDEMEEQIDQLLESMTYEEMLEAAERFQSSQFGELWVPCPKTPHVKALLESRRVNNLVAMAVINGLELSSAKKKDLVALLCSHLPDITDSALPWVPAALVFLWDQVLERGGLWELQEDQDDHEAALRHLMAYGLVFTVRKGQKKYLAAPTEHLRMYPAKKRAELLQKSCEADRLRELVITLLAIYGILPLSELFLHISELTGIRLTIDKYALLMNGGYRFPTLLERDDVHEFDDVLYVDNGSLDAPEEIIAQQNRLSLPFHRFDLETLDRLVDGECLANLPGQNELLALLCDHSDDDEAEDCVDHFIDSVQGGGDVDETRMWVMMLLEEASEGDRQRAARLLAELHDHTPQYRFKGYCAREISDLGIPVAYRLLGVRKQQKPGRNDPCICGSGRKYKNCCGR